MSDNIINRYCFVCQHPIYYYEFSKKSDLDNDKKIKKVWNSSDIEIFCCACLKEAIRFDYTTLRLVPIEFDRLDLKLVNTINRIIERKKYNTYLSPHISYLFGHPLIVFVDLLYDTNVFHRFYHISRR